MPTTPHSRTIASGALVLTTAAVMAIAPVAAGAAGASEVTAGHRGPSVAKQLRALGGTYWYVPRKYLLAYQRVAGSAKAKAVADQTLWHFTDAHDGFLFGCSYRSIDGGDWSASSIVGTVAPDRHVVIGFYAKILTVGQGTLVRHHKRPAFLMQVAGGPAKNGITHWAYMVRARPNGHAWNSLPGTGGQSVPSVDTGC